MGAVMNYCRVCGKEYEACRTANRSTVFRWQAVACSEECGAEYLRQVNESRKPVHSPAKATRSTTAKRSKSKAHADELIPMPAETLTDEQDAGDTV